MKPHIGGMRSQYQGAKFVQLEKIDYFCKI